MGQPIVLLLFAFDRAYRAWERGRDFEAGLWSGVLFLKVQYLPVLVLVLACKRRWPSVVGIAVTSLLIALASFAVFGERVTSAYLESLRSVSGFREVHPLICPPQMINWRGLLVEILPLWVPEAQAKGLTLLLSALTACSLAAVWRGRWDPTGPKFAMQMLATLLVTMIATYHNHLHGAALLIVPCMVLWARGGGPSPLPLLLRLGLFRPDPLLHVRSPLRGGRPPVLRAHAHDPGHHRLGDPIGQVRGRGCGGPVDATPSPVRLAHADGVTTDY